MTGRRTEGPGPNPDGRCWCGCGQPAPIAARSYGAKGIVAGRPLRYLPGHLQRRLAADALARRGGRKRGGPRVALRCDGCGWWPTDDAWSCWHCRRCGAFNRRLYVADHVDPARAARLTEAEIRAEYAAAGLPFRWVPAPGLAAILGTASNGVTAARRPGGEAAA